MIFVNSVMNLHVVGWLFNLVHVAMCITGRMKRQCQGIVSGQHFFKNKLWTTFFTATFVHFVCVNLTVGQTTC